MRHVYKDNLRVCAAYAHTLPHLDWRRLTKLYLETRSKFCLQLILTQSLQLPGLALGADVTKNAVLNQSTLFFVLSQAKARQDFKIFSERKLKQK